MWSTRKRKYDASPTSGDLDDHLLHIQAYEADIRCNPSSARSLEASGPQIGEALIKHSTEGSDIWLDRYARYHHISSLRNPCIPPGSVSDIRNPLDLSFIIGLSCIPLSYIVFVVLEELSLTRNPPDTMHASYWTPNPARIQENGGHHPHPAGLISPRIQKTPSSSVRKKPKTIVEISVAASWKALGRKGCGR